MKYKIIDDVLSKDNFNLIQNYFLKDEYSRVPWIMSEYVSGSGNDDGFYFTHAIYEQPNYLSPSFEVIRPIFSIVNPKSLMRIKANLYPKSEKIIHHKNHQDWNFSHNGCIFYLNTNDGFTVINDEIFVESIENRILLFDSSILHRSTTCTNKNFRMNINFNYF
jgi:hypothetical protein